MIRLRKLAHAVALAGVSLAIAPLAHAQITTNVLVRDGVGNVIANNVRSFDENEAGSGLALGFTPVVGSTFVFLYQANVVAFNNASGLPITPLLGLNQSFASGGYEFTVAARITEAVTSISTGAGITTATFAATGGTASFFFDNAANGGVQSNTPTGAGFDDGHLIGTFQVVEGAGVSNFTTFVDGTGIGATAYDFLVSGAGVESAFIAGLLGPITDLHFTSSQVLPPGTSTTSAFHTGVPSNAADIYPTTTATNGLLLKVDGSNTFTTSVPEPETYAMLLAGLGLMGFVARRRRRKAA